MADSPVVAAIIAATNDAHLREAMLLGSSLEGGWGPNYGVGDQGHSHGPYQINAPYHPDISIAGALDPKTSTAYMLPRYQAAVNAQSSNLWTNNPELAAEQAAVAAERPARSYIASDGQKTVDAKWAQVQQALSGNSGGSGGSIWDVIGAGLGAGVAASPIGSITDAVGSIATTFVNIGKAVDTIMTFITTKLFLPSTWARVLSFNVGAFLIIIGMWLFFSKPGGSGGSGGKAGKAAMAATALAVMPK